ncbi:MAG: hypothetical protein AAF549_00775 [Pseudomonadota bacterium]
MNLAALRGVARGDFARFSAGAINNQRAGAKYEEANAGDRYASFRARQHSGQGLPPPKPPM